jgi:dTDP-4-dehydrorhamnose 3,5-epimerase
MIFKELSLQGAYSIDLEKREDERGFFSRLFCIEELQVHGLISRIVQINNSFSRKKATLRGLHFQRPPKAETKIIRCLRGAIWDVIVDLRKNSTSFGRWVETNRTMIYVPQGFAHGFITLEDNTEILYLVSEAYSPYHEGTLRWNDPHVAVKWPLTPAVISLKDQSVADMEQSIDAYRLKIHP